MALMERLCILMASKAARNTNWYPFAMNSKTELDRQKHIKNINIVIKFAVIKC